MATSGEIPRPPAGTSKWPLTRDRTQRQIEAAIEHGATTRSEIYEHIQIEEGFKSIDGARKRVKKHGLEHLLPKRQHGQKRGS